MKQFYVYIHFKPDGTPFYVGKGFNERVFNFKHGRNKYHKNIVNKYGKENIEVLIFNHISEDKALEEEKELIKLLRREGYKLTNMTDGGEGCSGCLHSEETKRKIGLIHKGKILSEEQKEKQRIAMVGRKLSPEHKIKALEYLEKARNNPINKEKSRERIKKYRYSDVIGIGNGRAILNEESVIEIRNSKEKAVDLMKKFNISKAQFYRVKNKVAWKHIGDKNG